MPIPSMGRLCQVDRKRGLLHCSIDYIGVLFHWRCWRANGANIRKGSGDGRRQTTARGTRGTFSTSRGAGLEHLSHVVSVLTIGIVLHFSVLDTTHKLLGNLPKEGKEERKKVRPVRTRIREYPCTM